MKKLHTHLSNRYSWYSSWHATHPFSTFTHWLTFIGVALFFTVHTISHIIVTYAEQPVIQSVQSPSTQNQIIPNQYIIEFTDAVLDPATLAKDLATQSKAVLTYTYTTAIKGFGVRDLPPHALTTLQKNPHIKSITPDRTLTLADQEDFVPNWGLDRIDQIAPPTDAVYTYSQSGKGVHIYDIDTGIRASHSEFEGRVQPGFSAFGTQTDDCNGHGTHVAGIIAGRTTGVAKEASLYPIQVFNCAGYGTTSSMLAGIDWVTKHALFPAVANISATGSSTAVLSTAIKNSIANGITYVVAAGNESADACTYTPANVAQAITVAASDYTASGDVFSSGFSNYGSCVDIVAPGTHIYAASNTSDTAYIYRTGTSTAAGLVTGVVAQYLSATPSATVTQVTNTILSNGLKNVLDRIPTNTINLLLHSPFGFNPTLPIISPATTISATPQCNLTTGASEISLQIAVQSERPTLTIYRDSTLLGTLVAPSSSSPWFAFADKAVTPGTTYTYDVVQTIDPYTPSTHSRKITVTALSCSSSTNTSTTSTNDSSEG